MMCLVYTSAEAVPFAEEDLLELLRLSRINNERLGISGMLLHMRGSFMQALEGEQKDVLGLYERIRRDPRHNHVSTLIRFAIDGRVFPDWSMAFADMDKVAVADRRGFSSFLDEGFTGPGYASSPHRAVKLLQGFKETMMAGDRPAPVDWWY